MYNFSNLANLVRTGYKTNAYAPLVWLNAVVLPFLIIVLLASNNTTLQLIFGVLVCVIVLFDLAIYCFMAVKKPLLLQSEKYRIEDRKLDLISAKGKGITIEPVNLTLPHSEDEEQ